MTSLAADLASIKRKQKLQGRPLSRNVAAGVAEGRAREATGRLAVAQAAKDRERGFDIQERGLEQSAQFFCHDELLILNEFIDIC